MMATFSTEVLGIALSPATLAQLQVAFSLEVCGTSSAILLAVKGLCGAQLIANASTSISVPAFISRSLFFD
jgi:hypothetical protein